MISARAAVVCALTLLLPLALIRPTLFTLPLEHLGVPFLGASQSHTNTPSATTTPASSRSGAPSTSPSTTGTPSQTSTRTRSLSATDTPSASPSLTGTPKQTSTRTRSLSVTDTPSATATAALTATQTQAAASTRPSADAQDGERSGDEELRFAFSSAAEAARAAASSCATGTAGASAYESLLLRPPFAACTPTKLLAAMRAGERHSEDGPLILSGCRIVWYTPEEACALVERTGLLIFHGDSLTRHLIQGIITVLSGDFVNTTNALANPADPDYPPPDGCKCDGAYSEGHVKGVDYAQNQPRNKYCREHSVAITVQQGQKGGPVPLRAPAPAYCPAWKRQHLCANDWLNDAGGQCSGLAAEHPVGVAYLAGQPLHYPKLSADVIEAIFSDAARAGIAPPKYAIICGLLSAPETRRVKALFLEKQSVAATRAYNALVRTASGCSSRGDAFFDAYTVTENRTSIDGVHYGAATNVLLAQLLLNHVAAVVAQRDLGTVAAPA